jgi:glucose/arabinose dehydrogenase
VSRPGRGRALAAAAAFALVLAACGGGGDDGGQADPSSTTSTTRTPAPADDALQGVTLGTELVATVDTPTALAARPGTHDLYLAEQAGRVRRIEVTESADGTRTERLVRDPVLDLTDRVKSGGEQGLLGLTFSSDGRQLYVFATLEPDGQNWLGAFDVGEGSSIDADSGRDLLELDDEFPNHNGGQLALGPDGFLYVGLGDGGSGGDPHGHGQDTSELYGSILRLDPEAGEHGAAYAIPAGNPFEQRGGKPEIWLYGVRNPWRFSFDRADGDLWIADVGQGEWEELDHLPATDGVGAGLGANLGWNRMEGTHPFEGGSNPKDGVLPVFEYSHADGACAVVGGYVYRGTAIPDLEGAYLFTDYCQEGLRALTLHGGQVGGTRTFDLPIHQVQSFGEDADGELYALLTSGEVLRLIEG